MGMPTVKQRINITADKEMESALKRIAKRDRVPTACKAAELIALALELEEDIVLASIANERSAKPTRFISHESAWK